MTEGHGHGAGPPKPIPKYYKSIWEDPLQWQLTIAGGIIGGGWGSLYGRYGFAITAPVFATLFAATGYYINKDIKTTLSGES